MTSIFIGTSLGMISTNYIYQAFCSQPDWAAATERSWFQLVALLAVGLAIGFRSINQ